MQRSEAVKRGQAQGIDPADHSGIYRAAGKLAGSGICGVAVISAIYAAKDVKAAAADLKATVKEMLRA